MVNNAVEMLYKLLTDTTIPEGHVALVRIQNDVSYDQVMTNLEQVNVLPGFNVIGVTRANSNMRCDSLKSLMIINKLSKFL